MARKAHARYDWPALKAKYTDQRLNPGSTLSLREFGRQENIPWGTLRRAGAGWAVEAETLSASIAGDAMQEVVLDHTKIRKDLLHAGKIAYQMYVREMDLLEARRAELLKKDPKDIEPLSVSDLSRLEKMVAELFQLGGGLPREHVIHVDDSHDEVVLNREEQRIAAKRALAARRYGIKHGLFVVPGGKDAVESKG
ncbi:MAG: hypothetical protein V3U11_09990 [Planctomycetota bacterium]